jgi:F0F1-type ATP synthase membrane subunit b/b'
MSRESDIRENIESLMQTIRDAKRLKKELALQIKELDARLEKWRAARAAVRKNAD